MNRHEAAALNDTPKKNADVISERLHNMQRPKWIARLPSELDSFACQCPSVSNTFQHSTMSGRTQAVSVVVHF